MDPQNINPSVPPVPPEQPQAPQPVTPYQPQQQPIGPQPMPQPYAPQAPVQPTPMPVGYSTMPQPAKSGSKVGLIIGIVAGVIGLIVIATIALIVFLSMGVSRQDYNAAIDQYNKVSDANYKLQSSVSTLEYGLSTGTDNSFSNDIDTAKQAISDMKTESEALGKLKAVKVGQGKDKYKAFNDKITAYSAYAGDLITSLEAARPAVEKCDDSKMTSSSNYSQIKSAVDDCVGALGKTGTIPNSDIKEYLDKLKTNYEKLSSLVGKLAAIRDPYGSQYSQYSSLRSQVSDISDATYAASTDFQSNLQKHADEVDPKKAADDLGNYLTSQGLKS